MAEAPQPPASPVAPVAPAAAVHGGLSAARAAPAIDGEAAFVAVASGRFRLEASLTFEVAR